MAAELRTDHLDAPLPAALGDGPWHGHVATLAPRTHGLPMGKGDPRPHRLHGAGLSPPGWSPGDRHCSADGPVQLSGRARAAGQRLIVEVGAALQSLRWP